VYESYKEQFSPVQDDEIYDNYWNLLKKHKLVNKRGILLYENVLGAIKDTEYYKQKDGLSKWYIEIGWTTEYTFFDKYSKKIGADLYGRVTEKEFKTVCKNVYGFCERLYESALKRFGQDDNVQNTLWQLSSAHKLVNADGELTWN